MAVLENLGGYPTGPGVPPPGGQQTVVVSQPTHTVTTVVQHFGDLPSNTKCPNCQNQVTTMVSHEHFGLISVHLTFKAPYSQGRAKILIFFFLIDIYFRFWLCCCIPFCVDGMQNAIHHCPVCKYRIATYNR
nr:cell death-inducing p53-target protein 1-like [Lytechinus pictus]